MLTNDPTLGMYVAVAVAIVVVIGLFIYLWRIDRRVNELRRALDREPTLPVTQSIEPLRPQRRVHKEQIDGNDSRSTI